MHVDTSITKEQMRNMFESMSQFGLPIEVTEFDMFTDRRFVESHSKEEVEELKKKKIAEFCEVISEMKDKANIEGVSIWSVSDKQNFMINIMNQKIHKQNIERQKQGLEPIPLVKNVYGGYYDSEMKDITKSKTKGFNQEFNYHTHTYRSGHSTYTSDEEMLAAAKEAGITMLGFSEHIPNPDLILPDENHRMLLSEVDGYLASIRKMREGNPDMTILAGFEAEYNPMLDGHLCDMRDKVDYMILGQHFLQDGLQKVQQKNNPEYPIIYAKMVVKAMQSGIFDIVAHPDIFMEYRDTIETAEGREQFDRNAEIASRMICETARDMGIPVEINLSRAMQGKIMSDGNLAYPHPTFWKVASETEGLKVIKGIDAHNPRVFKDIGKAEELVANIERMVSDKMIKGPYNPVEARENNPKLKAAYETTKANAQTVETHLVNQIVNGTLAKMDDSLSGESIGIAIGTALTGTIQSCVDQASKKDNATLDEITKVADSPDLSPQDKKGKLERKKLVAGETNAILSNQQRVLERAKANVVEAMNMGCSTKQEYSSVISQMTEAQSTKNGTKKQRIAEQLTSFKQTKSAEKTLSPDKAQAKALIRDPNKKNGNGSNSNKSSGFANNTALALITSFGLGLLTGVSYMIFRILN